LVSPKLAGGRVAIGGGEGDLTKPGTGEHARTVPLRPALNCLDAKVAALPTVTAKTGPSASISLITLNIEGNPQLSSPPPQ
jgi:hypothetical protein